MEHKSRQNRELKIIVEKANNFHSTIKFTAEMSETEITFLNRKVYKGVRFNKEPILDVQRHHKPTRSPWANKKPVHVLASTTRREEMLHSRRSARASKDWFLSNDFWENIKNWENRLIERDYPVPIVIKYLSELKFADRKTFLQQSNKSARKKLQPSVTKGCCRCTLLAENSSISLAGREKQIHFSQQSPKMLWSCFSFFFSQNFPLGVPVLYRRVRWKELQVGNGTELQLEFSGQPVMVFQVFLQFPWLNHAHSGRSLFPCTSEMTKLTLTVKTDYVMSGTTDVDPHGRWNRSNDRKKWIKIKQWT